MPSTIIQVQSVTQPAPGRKRGRIQAANGQLFQADPSFLNSVVGGANYTVEYEDQSFNGATFRVVKNISPTTFPAPVGSPSSSGGAANPTSHPAPAGRYGGTDMATAERIFVCGALNAMLSNTNITPANMTQLEITHLVTNLRGAWGATFGKPTGAGRAVSATAPTAAMIDDDIPGFE